MGQGNFKLPEDYNTVAERIIEFRGKFPEGSLQPADLSKPYTIETINGNQCFVVVAAAYRTEEDDRPGIGMAYEPIPGTTPYTRGSELQNAETAAWGRAIVAVLAADTKKGIASHEEVRNRQEERNAPAQEPQAAPTTIRREKVSEEVLNDWRSLIEGATTKDELYKLHSQAKVDNAPDQVLAMIVAAGKKAA